MRDIQHQVDTWLKNGETIAIATVVQTWGSSPRKAGSKLALTLNGKMVGSVSGGCVENAVVEAGIETLKTNRPQLLHFGVADETAWKVGLACGGTIDIFVQPLKTNNFQEIKSLLNSDDTFAHITVINSDEHHIGREMVVPNTGEIIGSLGNDLDAKVLSINKVTLLQGLPRRAALDETNEIFINVIKPPQTLVIFGGVHIAITLASMAKQLGYYTILIDPRKAWGNEDRFPNVDQLIQSWPDKAFEQFKITSSTAIVTLTHDPKLDDPALKIALNSPAFYVGALGSKTTNAKRRDRLLSDGVKEELISKLHAPIGLNIGAENPEEIALAIMSEIVQSFRKQNQLEIRNEPLIPHREATP